MARPKLTDVPPLAELAAIACPAERYVALSRIAEAFRTLPTGHAQLRRRSLVEALDLPGRTMTALAEMANQSQGRVSQLYKKARHVAEPAM